MVDTTRHDLVFDRMRFNPRRVDVIGAGAVGSWCVLALAQLGVENIHVWDDDMVAGHNLANQFFFPGDMNQPKVTALAANVTQKTGIAITPHQKRVESATTLGDIVFVCVDTMRDRKQIFDTCIRNKLNIKMMVETRMGVSEYRIYRVRPSSRIEVQGWDDSWYSDDKVTPSLAGVCRAQVTVGTTAMMLGAHAAHQLVLWFQNESGMSVPVEHEQLVMLSPLMAVTNQFVSQAARSAA
jgi:molybdopterin/thiamine biosynthesis adenylyltransferase